MDPVTAVGVASAAIQFTDFSKAQKIRQDPRQAANGDVDNSDPKNKATHRCTKAGSQLLDTLQYVRGYGENISALRATFRVWRKRNTMTKLHRSLESDEKVLAQLLNESISRTVGRLDRNLIRELTGINRLSQEVLQLLHKQAQVLED
ncbi:hypothetical protein GGR57DRAFT_519200 [Xylariaceae sp. FL1272]|nr:hypothetical protein GGR57DRAFT_519200 [Xylariaceae sp. FL1272]